MLVVWENVVTYAFMNILIEDAETLKYFTNDNKWTKKASEGKSFVATEAAFDVAKKETDWQIQYRFLHRPNGGNSSTWTTDAAKAL